MSVSSQDDDTMLVTPAGEADIFTVPELRRALREAISAGRPHVIVDLDQLTFMDASTLRLLVDARLRMSACGGTLRLRCRTAYVRRLLCITGLDGMLDRRRDEDLPTRPRSKAEVLHELDDGPASM